MKPWVALVIALCAVGLAGAWIWYERAHTPTGTAALQEEFDWSFVDLGVNAASSTPETNVSLSIAGVPVVSLGALPGECFAIAGSPWPLLPNELSGTVCEWQGKGTEIGVFQNETGGLVLKQGSVTLSSSSLPVTRTNFTQLTKRP